MGKVRVVTDSASDMPVELLKEIGVSMVPLTVHFGDDQFQDALEMTAEEFYGTLESSPHHPRTSQPSPNDFAQCYQGVASEGDSVISIHLSSGLSGTYQAAELAKTLVPDLDVHVVDSRTGSLGYGLMVMEAARMAEAGASVEDIVRSLKDVRSRLFLHFSVDTLEYLRKNGRIGGAAHLLGTLLSMKPILTVGEDGYVAPVERVRGKGRRKVTKRLLELVQEHTSPGATIRCAVMHGNAQEDAELILNELNKLYQVEYSLVAPLGAIIGTHVGPGTLGVTFYECGKSQ